MLLWPNINSTFFIKRGPLGQSYVFTFVISWQFRFHIWLVLAICVWRQDWANTIVLVHNKRKSKCSNEMKIHISALVFHYELILLIRMNTYVSIDYPSLVGLFEIKPFSVLCGIHWEMKTALSKSPGAYCYLLLILVRGNVHESN